MTTRFYKVLIADTAAALIRTLHPQLKRKVKFGFRELARDPFAGKALGDELKGLRSFRIGRFRIIYRVSGRNIEVAAIGPRRTIYEETLKLVHESVKTETSKK